MASQATAGEQDAVQVPGAGVWDIDAAHSSVGFVARHLMVAKVRGSFGTFSGSVTIGERPEDSSVTAILDAVSINTSDEMRDGHLRSPDFLDVEKYPTLEFRTTKVEQTGATTLR